MVDISKISDTTKQMAMTKAEEPKPVEKPAPKKAEVVKKPEDTQAKIAEETKTAAKEAKAAEPPPPEPDALKELDQGNGRRGAGAEEGRSRRRKRSRRLRSSPRKSRSPRRRSPSSTSPSLRKSSTTMPSSTRKTKRRRPMPALPRPMAIRPPGEANLQGTDKVLSATTIDALRVAHPGVLVGAARRARGQYHRQGPLSAEHRRHRHRRAAGDERVRASRCSEPRRAPPWRPSSAASPTISSRRSSMTCGRTSSSTSTRT